VVDLRDMSVKGLSAVNGVFSGAGTRLAGFYTVRSSASFTMSTDVEKLELTGTAPINGTGNLNADVIIGISAANVLQGMAGADQLTGNGGSDTLTGGADMDQQSTWLNPWGKSQSSRSELDPPAKRTAGGNRSVKLIVRPSASRPFSPFRSLSAESGRPV
jgi:hypothetical protein